MRYRAALNVLRVAAVAIVLAAATYKAFDLDRYFVPKELVLHLAAALAALFCLSGCKRITLGGVDLALVGFLIAGIVSAAGADNHWAAERALAISFSGAALYWSASALRRNGLVRPLLVAIAVAVVVGAATSVLQAYGAQSELFSVNRVPGGTFGNRNFVAHLCAIGTPVVLLVALTARRGFGSLFGGAAMLIVAAALALSRSRAAWLAVILLSLPVGALALSTWTRWCEPRTLRRLIVLGVTAAAGAVLAIVLPNRLEWKSESPYLDSAAGLVNYKEGSGKGRLVQYGNTLRMTRTRPLLGVGPGNWQVVYPKYATHNDPSMSQDAGLTSNPWPSSDWVAFLSERGVAGIGFLLLAMIGLVWRAFRDLKASGRDAERILTAIALIGTLVATVIVGAFDAVLLVAVPTFFMWTLAGALAPPTEGGRTIGTGGGMFGPALVVVFGAVAVGRSVLQLAAMAVYTGSSHVAAADQAALLDPGSYRIETHAAELHIARGDCVRGRTHAHAAHDLFPSAAEPRRQIADCGGR